MYPRALYDLLANDEDLTELGITPSRIKELQSQDQRPFDSGYFVIFSWQETDFRPHLGTGPQTLVVWVHAPDGRTRKYGKIIEILRRIDTLFAGVVHETGADGARITSVRKTGQSGNLRDEAWETIAKNHTYSVLHSDS